VRVDYIYSNDKLYFIEINTIPGMSQASIVPRQVSAMGLELREVLTLEIEDAIERF
jgi:D-alanine-D-alanine ligase